jgi:predicted amidohydrolase
MSRPLRLSICAFNETGPGPKDRPDMDRLDRAMNMARRAKDEGAQLAVFPEDFLLIDSANRFRIAEPLDGPVFSKIAATAKQLDIFIAANHPAVIAGKTYNTSVLYNRRGKLEGCYRKAFPTMYEIDDGCHPGDGTVVLDTELGRIGFVTCFDLNFEPLRRGYAELDPDLLLFLSFYRGGLQTQIWAFETRSYLICSTVNPGSRIVNPVGRVLKFMDIFNRQLTHTIDLDYEVIHLDNHMNKLDTLRRKFGPQIDIDWVEAEGMMLLTATGKIPLKKIMDTMEFRSAKAYFDLSCEAIERAKNQLADKPLRKAVSAKTRRSANRPIAKRLPR